MTGTGIDMKGEGARGPSKKLRANAMSIAATTIAKIMGTNKGAAALLEATMAAPTVKVMTLGEQSVAMAAIAAETASRAAKHFK